MREREKERGIEMLDKIWADSVASPFTGGGLGQVECLGRGRPLA